MDLRNVDQILETKGKIVKLEEATNGRLVLDSKRKRESDIGESNKRSGSCIDCKSCKGNSLVNNYKNFLKSGLPQRVLSYQNGQWVDFPTDIIGLVRENFQMKRSLFQVQIHNLHSILDFTHMIKIDLETGLEKPIAWIDEAGGCFFPQLNSICNRRCTFHLSKSHSYIMNEVGEQESNTDTKLVKHGVEMNTRDPTVKVTGTNVYGGIDGRAQHMMGSTRFGEESRTRISFVRLFEKISDKLTTKDMSLLKMQYELYKRKKISRVEFVKGLKLVVGDKLLLWALACNSDQGIVTIQFKV